MWRAPSILKIYPCNSNNGNQDPHLGKNELHFQHSNLIKCLDLSFLSNITHFEQHRHRLDYILNLHHSCPCRTYHDGFPCGYNRIKALGRKGWQWIKPKRWRKQRWTSLRSTLQDFFYLFFFPAYTQFHLFFFSFGSFFFHFVSLFLHLFLYIIFSFFLFVFLPYFSPT